MGQNTAIVLVVGNVNDLFSIPFLMQYDPAVIRVEEVRAGGISPGIAESGEAVLAHVITSDSVTTAEALGVGFEA